MKTISEQSLQRLGSLLNIISPSMQEYEMIYYVKEDWGSVVPEGVCKVDAIGNLEFAVRRNDSYPTLALASHADTICVQITQKVGNCKYRFRSIGCSPHMLLGQRVIIVNESGEKFHGSIGFDATSQFGQPKGLIFEDLWIDVPESAQCGVIEVGDLVVLEPHHRVAYDCVTSTGLDDRLGLFVIGEVLRWYAKNDIKVNLTCVATVQEEVGLRGSLAFDFRYRPDAVIVIDVDYATDIPTPHEDQMGRLYLGDGPGILRKADNSARLRNLIKSVATARGLPLQTSLGRFVYGGTDSSSLQVIRGVKGVPVANITLPVRYMHSPVETASISDVINTIEIIKGLMEYIPQSSEFLYWL